MKHLPIGEFSLRLLAATLFLQAGTVWADDSSTNPNSNDGLTVLSNATNTTHWGIGAGVAYQASPYLGYDAKYTPIPFFTFDDKWVHAAGTTVDLKVGQWDNLALTLRGTYALGDGYKASDSPIFNGMPTREAGFWFGPALAWHTPYGVVSGDIMSSGNKGQRADIDFGKQFQYGSLTIEPHVGAEWLNSKDVDYYYGVPTADARVGRNAYAGEASYIESAGARFNYHFERNQMVSVDISAAHLGSGITDSPLVGRKIVPQANLGYLYQFN